MSPQLPTTLKPDGLLHSLMQAALTMIPNEKVSTAVVSLLPTWNSSGARCVTVPDPDLQGWQAAASRGRTETRAGCCSHGGPRTANV